MSEKVKISAENQQSSEEKWDKICEKVDRQIPFDNTHGWNDLWAVERYGYCDEVGDDCGKCPLYDTFCADDGMLYTNAIFWQFIETMTTDGDGPKEKAHVD